MQISQHVWTLMRRVNPVQAWNTFDVLQICACMITSPVVSRQKPQPGSGASGNHHWQGVAVDFPQFRASSDENDQFESPGSQPGGCVRPSAGTTQDESSLVPPGHGDDPNAPNPVPEAVLRLACRVLKAVFRHLVEVFQDTEPVPTYQSMQHWRILFTRCNPWPLSPSTFCRRIHDDCVACAQDISPPRPASHLLSCLVLTSPSRCLLTTLRLPACYSSPCRPVVQSSATSYVN